uniref:Opine dehydrogenase domain-containing protein n=1 Tax=Aplanochytrium stocchinoi TaxID=215587 RepID=A0A7S3PKN7_9STRA|mmetsp:Transcript_20490/g.24897  ORF Transcript_20490/g.24897 Transcript_20490/m.24897 type:complete len:408 (+) Transcript_20490:180-1403(+)
MSVHDKNFNVTGVCLIGAGHAVHASVPVLKHNRIENVRIFSNFGDEIQRFKEGMAANGGEITATFADHLTPSGIIKAKPTCVTDNIEEALKDVNVIVLPLPSFAYERVFQSLKPHLQPGMVVLVSPGQGGVHWVAKQVLGKKLYDSLVFFALSPMPFNCRVTEFGKHVSVQAFKTDYWVFTSPTSAAPTAISVTKQLYGGNVTDRGHIISAALLPLNANIHPQRLYSMLKDYKAGDILETNPLFYEEMTLEATDLMEKTSEELGRIGGALRKHGIPCDIPTILEAETFTWPHNMKGIGECPKDLISIFKQNPNYKGFKCPFKSAEGGWKPDFSNRYFTEDIPLGLCLFKGIGEICNVSTPTIDKIISWAQVHMQKSYLGDDQKLDGEDVNQTYAPQRFGFTSVNDLM